MKLFLIISRFKEDLDWLKDYTNDYLVYNKGEAIYGNPKIINVDNIGGNQRDIFYFIHKNYNNLPGLMGFMQGNPYDHCRKDVFDKLIKSTKFTPLEYYGNTPANNYENRDEEGGFMEINNNWYISAHNSSHGLNCKYDSFDNFMYTYFENYEHLKWLRFSPGSQYIIRKQQALQYPRTFWESLMNELPRNNMTEAHIIERSLYYIFMGKYRLRKELI
jgi:hypothetical protein